MSKKGNKGQTKEIKDQSYEVRDVVLAKIRGYPPWPGMVRPLSHPFHAYATLTDVHLSLFLVDNAYQRLLAVS